MEGMHGPGSRRNRRPSRGSAGRAVNVWRTFALQQILLFNDPVGAACRSWPGDFASAKGREDLGLLSCTNVHSTTRSTQAAW